MSDSGRQNSIEEQPLEFTYENEIVHKPRKKRCTYFQNQKKYLVILLIILFTMAGFLFGYFIHKDKVSGFSKRTTPFEDYEKMVSSKRLEQYLRYFSERPHVAGSKRQLDLAKYISKQWTSYGFDKVEMPEYSVLLSHPQKDKPNTVSLVQNGTVIYKIIGKINVTSGLEGGGTFQYIPYLAYSSSGTVEGELVYANTGSKADFDLLRARNISIVDKIVVFKTISGGVTDAAKYGAKGALFYPDPIQYSREGQSDDDTYPNTVWSSRDAIYEKPVRYISGDPLTPDLPSIPGMYRRPLNETGLPSIPSQPISYKDAMYLLSRMNGNLILILMCVFFISNQREKAK